MMNRREFMSAAAVGMAADMNVVAKLDPSSARDDDEWIDADPRAERYLAAVDDHDSAVDQHIVAEFGESEGFQSVARQKPAVQSNRHSDRSMAARTHA